MQNVWLHPMTRKIRKKDSLPCSAVTRRCLRTSRWLSSWVNRALRPVCWRPKKSIWSRTTSVCLKLLILCSSWLTKSRTVWIWQIKVSTWLPEMLKILLYSYCLISLLSCRLWKTRPNCRKKRNWPRRMSWWRIMPSSQNVYTLSTSFWKHTLCSKRTMSMWWLTDRWRL